MQERRARRSRSLVAGVALGALALLAAAQAPAEAATAASEVSASRVAGRPQAQPQVVASADTTAAVAAEPQAQPASVSAPGAVSVGNAADETEGPTGTWFDDAQFGWFPHWGLGTGPPADRVEDSEFVYRNAQEFEQATVEAGWSAENMVDVAKRLRADYITIAALHSRLGYLKIWDSDIPGSSVTERDFLGELIEAADAEGIRVVVYITGDPLWWNLDRDSDEPPSDEDAAWLPFGKNGWLDVEGYQEFKGDDSIDIRTRIDWKRHYAKDVVDELITKYPEIAGFWFDGWGENSPSNPETQANIEMFQFIQERKPDAVVFKNNSSLGRIKVPGEDVAVIEDCCGVVPDPGFDLASQAWHPPGEHEAAFETLGWWQRQADVPRWEPERYAFEVKKLTTAFGTDWVPGWGIGNDMSGGLPTAADGLADHVDAYMDWAEESLLNTAAGGYRDGGFDPGNWNEGAYGVTTLRPGEDTHYLHVLTPPQAESDFDGFVREAEDGSNVRGGGARVSSCGACSGGQKVGFIGNGPENDLTFPDVEVDTAGKYQLTFDYAVNGTRSFFVSVNGQDSIELSLSGTSFDTPQRETVTVPLDAGSNSIRFHNDENFAPDLDRIFVSTGDVPPDQDELGDTLVVPDGGYDVEAVEDLETGQPLAFTQSAGQLSVEVPSWDAALTQGATVLKVTTAGDDRVLPRDGWTATATTEDPEQPASHAIDGDYDTTFSAGPVDLPQFLTVDMGQVQEISGLRVTQPDLSTIPQEGRHGDIGSMRIEDYQLFVSTDGERWELASEGELQNQRGRQTISFPAHKARYLRFGSHSMHNGDNDRFEVIDLEAVTPAESIAGLRAKIADFQASGDLDRRLAGLLETRLDVAEGHLATGRLEAAVQQMEDFVADLNDPERQGQVSAAAKAELETDATVLLGWWRDRMSGPQAFAARVPADGATGLAPSNVRFTWEPSANAVEYRLTVATDRGFGDVVVDQATEDVSVVVPSLDEGTDYFWTVEATDADGATRTIDGAPLSFRTTFTQLPSAPTGVDAFRISADAVHLDWDAVSNAASYDVSRRAAGESEFSVVADGVTETSFRDDTSAQGAGPFEYRVTGVNDLGEGPPSSVAAEQVLDLDNRLYLSDREWVSASSGWRSVRRDLSVTENPLQINGVTYDKGLGTHAVSDIVYELEADDAVFRAVIGPDDFHAGNSSTSVSFQVFGDGELLFDSGEMRQVPDSPAEEVVVDVTGVQELRLHVGDAGDGINSDHADWGNAHVLKLAGSS